VNFVGVQEMTLIIWVCECCCNVVLDQRCDKLFGFSFYHLFCYVKITYNIVVLTDMVMEYFPTWPLKIGNFTFEIMWGHYFEQD